MGAAVPDLDKPPSLPEVQQRVLDSIRSGKLKSTLPFANLLNFQGQRFGLDDHYFFESLFTTEVPYKDMWMCGRQVGKSLNEVGGSVVLAALIPFFKQLVISPRFEQTKRLSTVYYKPFLAAEPMRSFMVDESCEQSVLQKSFRQNSMIFFSYAFTDAERVRGVSADMVWIDEAQDILWDLLPVIMETLSGSKHWGIQRFTGTPKSFANAIHKNWNLSSQGYWTIKCEGCNRENIGSVEDHLLDMIGPTGPICHHCGKDLDSRKGYYLHRFPERYNEFRGRNVTQPLHPYHYEHPHRWKVLRRRVMGKDFAYSTAKTYNEVLGASYDSAVKPITLSDIKKAAVGGNNTIPYANRRKKECVATSLGVDWGGGGDESKSYTAITFQGLLPNGNIELMFCHRLQSGLSQIEEAKIILEFYRMLAPDFFAHDFTGGGDGRETIMLQATRGSQSLIERLVPYTYSVTTDRNVIYYHPPATGRRKSYIIDKPRSLLTMALMLRGGRIILPDLESCYDQVQDLLNLSEERQERPRGSDVVLIHKDPETSDDIAHALNFGCSALWYSRGEYPSFAEAASIRLDPEDLEEIDPSTDRLTLSQWTEE
jgi:hypothetical protein